MHAGSLRSQIGGKTMHAGSLRSQIGGLDRHCPRTYTPELASQQASWHALQVLDAVKWVLGLQIGFPRLPARLARLVSQTPPFIYYSAPKLNSMPARVHCERTMYLSNLVKLKLRQSAEITDKSSE